MDFLFYLLVKAMIGGFVLLFFKLLFLFWWLAIT